MSDCGTSDTAASADCSSAPDASTQCSSFGDPPPDYSSCVSHSTTVSSNHPESGTTDTTHHSHPVNTDHITVNSISEDRASEVSPLNGVHDHGTATGHILHDIASSAPFLDGTPGFKNRNDGYVPRHNPYNPQPSYNPSYVVPRHDIPRTVVHGRQTIVLQRTDAENNARKRKIIIGLCVGLLIGSIIPIVTVIYIFTARGRHSGKVDYVSTDATKDRNHNDIAYDGLIFDTPRVATIDPYLTDRHKDNFDDKPWKSRNIDTETNPLLDDRRKNNVDDKPRSEKTDDDIFRDLGIITPDFADTYKHILELQRKISDDTIIKPITISDDMKDLLGIPREQQTKRPPLSK